MVLQFENLYFPCMLDTGAEVSCISKEKAIELLRHAEGNADRIQILSTSRRCTAANNQAMSVNKEVKMKFSIANVEFTFNLLVVDGLSCPILLGSDFIRKNIENVNNKLNVLTLAKEDGAVRVPFFYGKDMSIFTSHVRVTDTHVIPPRTAKLIRIEARTHIPLASMSVIFLPVTKRKGRAYRPVGPEIVTLHDRVGHILYENHSTQEVTVKPHAIGIIYELRDTHVMTMSQMQELRAKAEKEETASMPKREQTTAEKKGSNASPDSPFEKRARRTDHSSRVVTSAALRVDAAADGDRGGKKNPPSATAEATSGLPPGFQVLSTLTSEQQKCVTELVQRYNQAFVQHEHDHGLTDLIEHKIELSDKTPLYIRQFPLDLQKAKAVDEWVDKLIALDKMELSDSPWNTPVFVVPKPKGDGWRIVNDFRQINMRTKRMQWPLPHVQHALDSLGGSTYFTQIDLSDAFFQIPLAKEHREYTAFNTGTRHVQYKVMPMGLVSSTSTFQRLMTQIFHDTPWLRPYVDDLIVPASSFAELIERTEFVFERLRQAGLKMSGKKTFIGLTQVNYLGYICSKEGIKMDPKKIETVKSWPKPITVTQLRQFIGLCSHLRRHIKDFARIADPLTKQQGGQKDTQVLWGPAEEKSFSDLKAALCDTDQVLAYPDYSKNAEPFIVETDACKVSEGAVLKQKQNGVERVIAYSSRSFTPTERAWGMTQLEAHAIYWAITKQYHYYLKSSGKVFHVRTDHRPCLAMQVRKVAAERMHRWALELQGYDMEMFHIDGKKHIMSDAVSRLGYLKDLYESMQNEPTHVSVLSVETNTVAPMHTEDSWLSLKEGRGVDEAIAELPQKTHMVEIVLPLFGQQISNMTCSTHNHTSMVTALAGAGYQPEAIQEAQQRDETTCHLWAFLKNGIVPPRNARNMVRRLARQCFLENDILYRRGGQYQKQLLVPLCLREELLVAMHDAPSAGHFGVFNTIHRLSKHYWWPGMSREVHAYVNSCQECAHRNVPPHMRVRAPAVKEDIPRLFERVSVDIQGEFTKSKQGNRWLVTFLDVHSRWIEGFAVSDISAYEIAKLLVTQIILRYGPIHSLLSDRGSNFLSQIIRETCRIFRIQKLNIAAYHPESNAHVERIHRVYSDSISKYIGDKHDDWDEIFPFIQWAYRSSIQATLQASPYELVFGREARAFVDLALLPPPPARLDDDVKQWSECLAKRIEKSQEAVIEMTRESRERLIARSTEKTPRTFAVGDKVMIRNHTVTIDPKHRRTHKWAPRFIGPYVVVAKQGDITYKVANPADNADKRVISVDDMKKCYPRVLRQTRNVRVEDLTITGDSHDFNRIDVDETEVDRILDRRLWSMSGKKNEYEYLVRYKNLPATHDEWILEKDLFAPDLVAEFNKTRDEDFQNTRHYKTSRSGKVKRSMMHIVTDESLQVVQKRPRVCLCAECVSELP